MYLEIYFNFLLNRLRVRVVADSFQETSVCSYIVQAVSIVYILTKSSTEMKILWLPLDSR